MSTDVYASAAELTAIVGAGTATESVARVALALIAATRWVRFRVGDDVGADDDVLTAPYTIAVIATTPARKAACLAAATRFFKAPDVPFGVMGTGDYGMSVKTTIPEAEVLLLGQRTAFGFA